MNELDRDQRILVHQVHPAKLAVDIGTSAVSDVLLWRHRLAAGLAVRYLLPALGSALVLRFADLQRLSISRPGRYVNKPARAPAASDDTAVLAAGPESTAASVNSALNRARATPEQQRARGRLNTGRITATEADVESLVSRYVEAWQAMDIASLVALLKQDGVLTMPPLPLRVAPGGSGRVLHVAPARRPGEVPHRTDASQPPTGARRLPARRTGRRVSRVGHLGLDNLTVTLLPTSPRLSTPRSSPGSDCQPSSAWTRDGPLRGWPRCGAWSGGDECAAGAILSSTDSTDGRAA